MILENEVLGISLIRYDLVEKAKPEDFTIYSEPFKLIQKHKGYSVDLLKNYKNIYRLTHNSQFTQFSINRMLLELFESTYKRLLDKTYTFYSSNTLSALEVLKIDEIKNETKEEDIISLVENLPAYFKANGLKVDKINKWSVYCLKRIEDGV